MDHFADVNADVKSDVNADVNVDMIADVTIPPPKTKPEWTKWLSLIFIFVSAIIAWKSKEIVHFLINTFNDLKHRFYKPAAPASAICKSDLMNDFIGSHMQSQNDALSQMEEMIVDSTQGEASDSSHIPFHTSPDPLFHVYNSDTQKPTGSVEALYENEEYEYEVDPAFEVASIPEPEQNHTLSPVPTPEPVPEPVPVPEHLAEPVHVCKEPKPDDAPEQAHVAVTEPVVQSLAQDAGDTKKVRKRKPKMVDLVD